MRPFTYHQPKTLEEALAHGSSPGAKYLGGGTNLIDLMKEDVEQPNKLIYLGQVQRKTIEILNDRRLFIPAGLSNSETANHPLIRTNYPILSQAILAGASVQIRNMATNGGNLLQRTRCPYFYDVSLPCNKRKPGSGCGAMNGFHRMHSIFGWNNACIATHPSDMCVALTALDAKVITSRGENQLRAIPIADFHTLSESNPEKDNSLELGELITDIELPPSSFNRHSYYLKIRDRSSYAFALISVAAMLEMGADSRIMNARLALGGVAHKPWRLSDAENMLIGQKPSEELFRKVANLALSNARPLEQNKFKVLLGEKGIERALTLAYATQ